MEKQLILAAVIYPIVNAVLFGAGAAVVLSFFEPRAAVLLPIVVGWSFALAAPIAWLIAPSLSLELSGKAYPNGRRAVVRVRSAWDD